MCATSVRVEKNTSSQCPNARVAVDYMLYYFREDLACSVVHAAVYTEAHCIEVNSPFRIIRRYRGRKVFGCVLNLRVKSSGSR